MTSKEFLRRCEFFAVFDKAAELFYTNERIVSIFKFSCFFDSSFAETYSLSVDDFSSFLDGFYQIFNLAYIESYSRSQFLSQFKYFLSFLSRLSDRQMSLLVSSGRFDNLLKFNHKI